MRRLAMRFAEDATILALGMIFGLAVLGMIR